MRKEKGSLTFWLTVCVLVICVAMARDNSSTSKAKGSTDVVYPDYYAKTSDDLNTTNNTKAHRNTKPSTKKEDKKFQLQRLHQILRLHRLLLPY